MTKLGLPVPPGSPSPPRRAGSTWRTAAPGELRVQVTMALRQLEDNLGRRLGDRHDPLLVSVRSGAAFSMPGMMETVLNIGLNDASVKGLAEESGDERFAWDSYRRLLQMFGKTVLEIPGEVFSDALDKAKAAKGITSDVDLDVRGHLKGGADVPGHRAGRVGKVSTSFPASRLDLTRSARCSELMEHRPGPHLPPPSGSRTAWAPRSTSAP